jgi:hypothetical protein
LRSGVDLKEGLNEILNQEVGGRREQKNLGGGREGDYDDAHVVPAPLVEACVDHLGLNLNHI